MGKRRQRSARRQENNIGCMWGLIRMFYFRRDAKFLMDLDRKQGNTRHTFSGFAGRGHSRKKSRDFEDIDGNGDTIEECSTRKPTVKRLMEDELGKVKQVKKIPSDEVERILADLGHDICLEKSSMHSSKQNGAKSHSTSTTMASPSGLLDPSSSKSMKHTEEDDLQLSLADFLGQIHMYHDEWPHDDCKNKNELCPELKSLIHKKLHELKSAPCAAYEKTQDSEQEDPFYEKHLRNSRSYQSTKFIDAPDILSPERELFLKTFQKPNPHTWEKKNTQKHQHKTTLGPMKMLEKVDDTKNSKQHEVAIKTHNKESRNIFFWRRDKSIRGGSSEGTNSDKAVNKIVILKPNPRRGINTTVATAPTCLQQQSCTIRSPEYSATESSKFSIRQVRRRFRIVAGETRKEKPSIYDDDFQRDPCWSQDSVFTIKKDSRRVHEQTLAQKASSIDKDDLRPSTSGKHKSSPKVKDCIDLSPEETNISGIHKAGMKEFAKEINQYDEDSGNVACGASEVLDDKADQESHSMKQETTQDGDIMHVEEITKPDCSEAICSEQTTPLEMIEGVEPGKEHVGMFLSYPGNAVESLEHQEPKTPRSGASLELISQISPEGNHEKQEQPSPVSVLDPFFHEDIDSPDRETMTKYAISYQQIFWEDEDARLAYIKAVLDLSELCTYQNIEVWYLEDELTSPCLVEELHQGNPTDDLKLLFDCICEAITIIQETYFRNPPCLSFVRHKIQTPPMGQNLIPEINKHIERHLYDQFPSTLHELVNMDLEYDTWMNLQSESEEIVVDIWDFILDELLEDVATDLWI
ncbi:hypothetical protein GUJ93_ZPchr0006g44255 [Zizania palustris]|uniref:DUF4378 domain-containing protein n=1 Tax=Zizania palustris TaxID=103762 RepID=A0A8J5T9D2_ZIZPA|nr:hypothetical protein GUJ93_ZPchr0006g44255 [Zizania palustris]